MQQQLGNGLLLPVWIRLQLNDGQECGPLKLDIAVQKQLKARSGYKFLVHGLNKVFSNESHLAVIKATCWHLELPSLFCHIRCPNAVAVEISGAVQGLQQDTAGFDTLQCPFYDFPVRSDNICIYFIGCSAACRLSRQASVYRAARLQAQSNLIYHN